MNDKGILTLLGLFALGLMSFAGIVMVNDTKATTKLELEKSCQTGVLLYVLKYKQDLSIFEKQKRMRFIAKRCEIFANTYLENR